ncbi:hypothetical protein SLEP1_g15150 [Rubroshorea leprosula]|uniref:Uncharacterized protein n=1 Tax=Rubroshorea leprosula TaxID=152421 RepID=A0AAV5IQS0_9ROSI|nr:hypothetical protein SLEP1_g15150 [Rubroshorea leprosula]
MHNVGHFINPILLFFPLQPKKKKERGTRHQPLRNRIRICSALLCPVRLLLLPVVGAKFWAVSILGEPVSFPCSLPPASSPLQLRFLQLENYDSRSFCQLALRSSARFYASEVSKFMVMPIQFLKACFDLFLK